MIDGRGLINPLGKLDWVIDFTDISIEEASEYQEAFNRVRENINPEIDKNKNKKTSENWWLFERHRPAMRKALENLGFYFTLLKIAQSVIFTPVDISILP